MASIPDVQLAWTVVRRGKPAKALVLQDWPVDKKLEKGEIIVKVQAAALNPVGYKIMRLLPNLLARRPHIAEHDFCGYVVDANGSNLRDADNVYGWISTDLQLKTGQGVLAQYIKVPADHVVTRPINITPTQAAGMTLACLTAYQALFNTIKLEADQTIFINGGSTSVGAFAIQLAKIKGAKVVATASARNEKFVRQMGADEFIDYTKEPLVEYLNKNPPSTKYHAILDAVGLIDPSLYTCSAKYLSPVGIFASVCPQPHALSLIDFWQFIRTVGAIITPSWLGNIKSRWAIVFVKNNLEDLQEIRTLIENGSLRPIVDSVYGFEDALKAYDRILTSRAVGKVVIKVDRTVD